MTRERPPMQTVTDEQLLALIHQDAPIELGAESVYRSPLELLRGKIGDDLGIVAHYLTTGSESAIRETRAVIRPYINIAIYNAQMELSSPTWDKALHALSADDAEDVYTLSVAMKQAWNFGNVLHETGHLDKGIKRLRHCWGRMLKSELSEYDKRLNPDIATDNYWRGVALLTLVKEHIHFTPYTSNAGRIAKLLIAWAGSHKDISLVYQTIVERDTLDVEVLKGFLTLAESSPTLGRGVL